MRTKTTARLEITILVDCSTGITVCKSLGQPEKHLLALAITVCKTTQTTQKTPDTRYHRPQNHSDHSDNPSDTRCHRLQNHSDNPKKPSDTPPSARDHSKNHPKYYLRRTHTRSHCLTRLLKDHPPNKHLQRPDTRCRRPYKTTNKHQQWTDSQCHRLHKPLKELNNHWWRTLGITVGRETKKPTTLGRLRCDSCIRTRRNTAGDKETGGTDEFGSHQA